MKVILDRVVEPPSLSSGVEWTLGFGATVKHPFPLPNGTPISLGAPPWKAVLVADGTLVLVYRLWEQRTSEVPLSCPFSPCPPPRAGLCLLGPVPSSGLKDGDPVWNTLFLRAVPGALLCSPCCQQRRQGQPDPTNQSVPSWHLSFLGGLKAPMSISETPFLLGQPDSVSVACDQSAPTATVASALKLGQTRALRSGRRRAGSRSEEPTPLLV